MTVNFIMNNNIIIFLFIFITFVIITCMLVLLQALMQAWLQYFHKVLILILYYVRPVEHIHMNHLVQTDVQRDPVVPDLQKLLLESAKGL